MEYNAIVVDVLHVLFLLQEYWTRKLGFRGVGSSRNNKGLSLIHEKVGKYYNMQCEYLLGVKDVRRGKGDVTIRWYKMTLEEEKDVRKLKCFGELQLCLIIQLFNQSYSEAQLWSEI